MDNHYILLICAGVVFLFFFLIYLVTAIRRRKEDKTEQSAIRESYSDKNVRKMEYDLAFYGEEARGLVHAGEPGQVTMDEVIGTGLSAGDKADGQSDEALFAKIENEGVEEITGNFKP